MPLLKARSLLFMLALVGSLFLSLVLEALGFIALEQDGRDRNTLIKKVHTPHWVIHFSYGDNCPPEQRNNGAALTTAVTEALQMWLESLREYTDRPIVNDFRYVLDADRDASDLTVVFHCKDPRVSTAAVSRVRPPQIDMRKGTKVTRNFMEALAHEMGHAFGLADTYIPADKWGKPGLSKGGKDSTKGTQPSSAMSGLPRNKEGGMLGKDDKNGVIYLYKVIYEGLSIRNCFFSDYQLEHEPLGCRPKHPLIFEIKHVSEITAVFVIREDETLDLNARDADGLTALHHAILNAYAEVVEILLAHPKIKVNIRSNDGRTPAQLARDLGRFQLTKRIWEHPTAALPPWSVVPKGKLATTWGHLKRRY